MGKNDLTNPWKQNKDKYIKYRNKLKALLRKSERLYYNEQFNAAAGNAKETWNILNAVLNKKHDVSDLYTILLYTISVYHFTVYHCIPFYLYTISDLYTITMM